jgi:hypothetical protein
MFAVRYLKENGHKFLFGNAGSNEKNNCKPDHNRSELLCQWLVKYKYRVIHEKGTSEFLFCRNQQYNGSDYYIKCVISFKLEIKVS